MRKSIFAVAGLVAALGSATSQADPTVIAEGTILINNPAFSASDLLAGCDGPLPEANGIDGIAFEVPEGANGQPAALTTTGATAIDADVYWWSAACGVIDSDEWATDAANEVGTIPVDAAYGVVSLFLGANADVSLATL